MGIPFWESSVLPEQENLLSECLRQGVVSGGVYSARLRKIFCAEMGAKHIFFVPSGTHALELACHLLCLSPGDEVLIPSYNFPSAANAVLLAGGVPVFCDVTPDTLNISSKDVARRITPRTRAIIAVHYAAVACDMDALAKLAAQAGIVLIEDAAQAVGAFYNKKPLGTLGRFGAYSFHSTKNFSCGEGGALVCGDEDYERACIFSEKGTNRLQYLRGETARYEWMGRGSSYIMSELCAAALLPQIQAREQITVKRMALHEAYMRALAPAARTGALRLMAVPEYARPNGHLFYVQFPNIHIRDRVQAQLAVQGIDARTHYVPLHISPMGRSLGYAPQDLPESLAAYETLLRLPLHPQMCEQDVQKVAQAVIREVLG